MPLVAIYFYYVCEVLLLIADTRAHTLEKALAIPKDYAKELHPGFERLQSTPVDIFFHIVSFGPVIEQNMIVSTEIYLRSSWTDKRLIPLYTNLSDQILYSQNTSRTTVFLAGDYYNQIWKPDLYFPDAVEVNRPIIETDDSLQLQVDRYGNLLYSMRLIVQTRCRLKMALFPLDQQECPLCVSHYKYPLEEQVLRWYKTPVDMAEELSTPHFYVNPYVENATNIYSSMDHKYTNLCARIKFSRKLTQYFLVMYFPSFTLTGLSFLNFWLDKKAVPARASLSITSILAQITLMTGVSMSFPSGSDLKSIDIYLMVNFIFTVCTIIEFTMVSYGGSEKQLIKQRTQMNLLEQKRSRKESKPESQEDNECRKKSLLGTRLEATKSVLRPTKSRDIDVISRFVLITLFLIWNVMYFAVVAVLTKYRY